MLQIGHLVRRVGAQADTKNTGVIVETVSPADQELAAVLPAQLKVYWRVSGLIEELLSTEVEGAYPGGNAYRAWDGDFPLFAVETGGFGDITVITPDGETAITVTEEDMATGAREYTLDPDSDQPWKHQVLTAVERYLDKTAPDGARVASSLPRGARDETCVFHAHNPLSGSMGQCTSTGVTTVVLAATTPNGVFKGDGVQARVCAHHGRQLAEFYKAVPVPETAGASN